MAALTVSQALLHLNNVMDIDPVLRDMCIIGEVSKASTATSGHKYFTAKDDEGSIDCALFRGGIGGEHLQVGVEIIIFGRISVYPKSGRLQLIANLVQPSGIGVLQAKFEEMKARLESEGMFELSRKRLLPRFPKVIGVVASEDSAAWQDIKRTMTKRYPNVEIVLAHTLVQGDRAPSEIVNAINILNKECIDVIIVARGGGSVEDLWAFNEEIVARSIFASRIPIITGIGHETDFTIADMVADKRSSTPTGAVVDSVPDIFELAQTVLAYRNGLNSIIDNKILNINNWLSTANLKLNSIPVDFDILKLRLDDLIYRSESHLNLIQQSNSERWDRLRDKLLALGPGNTIERGYSIVQRLSDGKIVTSESDLNIGEKFSIQVVDGKIYGITSSENEGNKISDHQPPLL
jgi:exodeoxyribonuclease VII large subunit